MEAWTTTPDIILNYSGVCHESGLADMCPGSILCDFESFEGTNCYVDPESYEKMRSVLSKHPYNGIHWIDTGDYHYATKLFLEKIDKPFALLLFDHHPDMQRPAFPVLSCGSWLRDSLEELPKLKHATIIGIAEDLAGECEGFPGRTDVFTESEDICALTDSIAGSIPNGLPVYISIDKDVFTRDHARTDWDQGCMTPDSCLEIIKAVRMEHEILGIDLCGAITLSKGASDADFEINNTIDRKLLHFLRKTIIQSGKTEK
ncbi:MAG: arginase family protein [Bacteroidales bacterium]|nr:arginase family protein [Bacteroidales bacterium]